MEIGISYSDYYLPSKFMSTKDFYCNLKNFSLPSGYLDIESYCESVYKQKKITGIYIEEEKKEIEIFKELVEKFFNTTQVNPEDIDIIIYTKGVPLHENKVSVPYYIQKIFGLVNATTFNVDQTCGASLMSMHIAETMIRTGNYRSALILSSSFIKSFDKRNVQITLISDGAGLLYVDNNPQKLVIKDFLSRTTGSTDFSIESFTKRENYKELIRYLQNGSDTIKYLLKRNNIDMDSIKLISPQNTTYSGWEIYASLLDINISKVFLENIPKGAHMGDVDTIRNITDISAQNLLNKGEFMIAYGLGWGSSWNTALLEMRQGSDI